MTFLSLLYVVLIVCLFSSSISSHHILVIAPPMFSHLFPSLELAKQLSIHCHVTYLVSTSRLKELEYKGIITAFNNSTTLDIVGLNDGNNESLDFFLNDSQIDLNNITEAVMDDHLKLSLNTALNRMGSTLSQLFHSDNSICTSSSSIQSCSLKLSSLQSLTTRPISRPINMIIARSVTPLPSFNSSIPVYLFLPSNLRGVVSYLSIINTNDSHRKDMLRHLRKNIDHANGFICNSLKEFDENYVDEFHRLSGNQAPIHFVGPIVFDGQVSMESKSKEIISWLDKQPVASVIYIAFGSVVRLPPTAIDTVAHALSRYSFIWSLKTNGSVPSSLMNLDTNHQLVLEWTPQRTILAHPSVALFFSHGGWNSLIEGMLHGKAMLLWPFFADQFNNTLQLVDMGIARQVSNDLQSDIEHMFINDTYSNRAKQTQRIVIKARETSSKEQIAAIGRFISNKANNHNDL